MKKIITIIIILIMFSLSANEWIKVGDRDYKLFKIYPEKNIVVADGFYDIVVEDGEVISMIHLGGLGAYFYYAGEKQNITLEDEAIERLIVQCFGEPEEEE